MRRARAFNFFCGGSWSHHFLIPRSGRFFFLILTILDKVTLQQQDTTKIFVFKEGLFYKAYNEGAFLLKDKNYKITVKQIKSIENEVLSIGFPISVLEKLKENRQPEEYDNYCSLQSNIVFSLLLYEEWYQNQIANIKREDSKYLEEYTLKDTIKNYPLANKTPIEVFIWVAELQKLISK